MKSQFDSISKFAYDQLPNAAKPVAQFLYKDVLGFELQPVREDFIECVFGSVTEYERYAKEFDESAADLQSARLEEFYQMVPRDVATFGGMSLDQAQTLYAIVRAVEPDVIVETGVCNGVSTLVVLMALEENERGALYSIDFPTYSDDPVPDFQRSQYPSDHTFSAIPQGKSPGWIIPEDLRTHWELRTGKSQRLLPGLLEELEEVDIFIHDSDHTLPCMMFEYEVAWEYLSTDGLLLSDDINANAAFELFGEARASEFGEACPRFGYALR